MTRTFCAALAWALSVCAAQADPPEIMAEVPMAEQVGAASYTFLAWTVFDAALWAEEGVFAWDQPFALSLTYRRAFTAQALTAQTLREMEARGAGDAQSLALIRTRLDVCFPDVAPGDRITAVSLGVNRAHIYHNGSLRCVLEWRGLRRSFFGIWLEARGEARTFSRRLRGES